MELSWQEYWSRLPFPSPGDLSDWVSCIAGGFFTIRDTMEAHNKVSCYEKNQSPPNSDTSYYATGFSQYSKPKLLPSYVSTIHQDIMQSYVSSLKIEEERIENACQLLKQLGQKMIILPLMSLSPKLLMWPLVNEKGAETYCLLVDTASQRRCFFLEECDLCSAQLALLFHSVMSDSLRPQGLLHAKLPCPSLPPGVCSELCCIRFPFVHITYAVHCILITQLFHTQWFIPLNPLCLFCSSSSPLSPRQPQVCSLCESVSIIFIICSFVLFYRFHI